MCHIKLKLIHKAQLKYASASHSICNMQITSQMNTIAICSTKRTTISMAHHAKWIKSQRSAHGKIKIMPWKRDEQMQGLEELYFWYIFLQRNVKKKTESPECKWLFLASVNVIIDSHLFTRSALSFVRQQVLARDRDRSCHSFMQSQVSTWVQNEIKRSNATHNNLSWTHFPFSLSFACVFLSVCTFCSFAASAFCTQ